MDDTTKGQKKLRGQPEHYDEVKGQVNLSMTKTAREGLDSLAKNMDLSRSELVEQIGREIIPILTPIEVLALQGLLEILNQTSHSQRIEEKLIALRRLMAD